MAKPCSWYTVYSAKTDEIIASGTADMIVQQMGYVNKHSLYSAVTHSKTKKDHSHGTFTMCRRYGGRNWKRKVFKEASFMREVYGL